MPTSKVYFTDLRTQIGVSQLDKLEKLIRAAGIGDIDFDHKMTAIKIHFGEPGNLTYLRPNYAKRVADVIKSLGGLPFLTDCNTLYPGRRKNALEHIESAYENGFTPYSTGCQVIIADGLKGSDDIEVPVQGGEYVKAAKIGRAIMDADIFISLSHFKGHERPALAALSRTWAWAAVPPGQDGAARRRQAEGRRQAAAWAAAGAPTSAPTDAISFGEDRKASIDHSKCVGCGRCIAVLQLRRHLRQERRGHRGSEPPMAEYAKAVVDGRPQFHISLVIDVSPYCDCHGENDMPILPDVGMFASFDPVALDQACADACLKQEPIPGSHAGRATCTPRASATTTTTSTTPPRRPTGRVCLEHAEKIGLGSRSYELIRV